MYPGGHVSLQQSDMATASCAAKLHPLKSTPDDASATSACPDRGRGVSAFTNHVEGVADRLPSPARRGGEGRPLV